MPINVPLHLPAAETRLNGNIFVMNDEHIKPPVVKWRAHANLLYVNWLNYHVYQETPLDLNELR